MQQRPTLEAVKRAVLGKQVKKLRRDGVLPGNVYGKDLESTAIQVDTKTFEAVYKEVGETGLVDLKVENETRPVLIKNLQLKYPLRTPLHVDFYQVNLKEKVKAMIPIELIGEAKAVTEQIGTMIQTLSEVEVEALPTDLPEKIEVSVEHLANLDEQIAVSDLKLPENVTLLTDPAQIIVKIAELAAPEPEPVPEEAPAEGEEGAAETEGTKEGEQPDEGAKPEGEKGEGDKGKEAHKEDLSADKAGKKE